MPIIRAMVSLGLLLCTQTGMAFAQNAFDDKFCILPPHDRLCSTFPNDQADFDSSFEYMNLVKGAQDPFDVFSWQAFVALNWPVGDETGASGLVLGQVPDAPRAWQRFSRRESVFGTDKAAMTCAGTASGSDLLIDELAQADDSVLIDQDLNFVVYDTRLNPVVIDYVRAHGLQSAAGQRIFDARNDLEFPQGRLADPDDGVAAVAPSILIKTSWRVLSEPAQEGRFFVRNGVIHVPAARSQSGVDLCLSARLGLVGMHIVVRTHSGHGDEWIWTTFEHVDNVPPASNARNVNSIYSNDLFAGGCKAPASAQSSSETKTVSGRFSFFDPDCEDCAVNVRQGDDWSWSAEAPFARLGGVPPARGAQVVRCWDIFESSADLNRRWRGKLRGTAWSNYMLVSTQWRGAAKSPLFEQGEVPRYLTNTTLETFLQDDRKGSCMGCHAEAISATGKASNFTFLLRHAE